MHTEDTETECLFWVRTLSELAAWQYAYLAKSYDDYFFVRKSWDNYIIQRIDTLTDSDISDRMREDYDSHEAWVEAVQSWETDSSYDDWSQDIDIWEECDSSDYYGCNSQVVKILYDLWLWSSEEYDYYGWDYLDEWQSWTLNADILDNLYRKFETNDTTLFNESLWHDIEKKYGVNQIQFLAAEPIR